jgi:hypothetical protein
MDPSLMAAARMQPHMISQCVAPRRTLRLKMKRLAANSMRKRRPISSACAPIRPGLRAIRQPRRQYIRVGGRRSHIA